MSFMLPQRQQSKSAALVRVTRSGVLMPALIAEAGDRTARRFIEFFTANIRNKNTRAAYGRSAGGDDLQLRPRLGGRRDERRGLLPARETLLAAAAGKRRKAARSARASQGGRISRRLPGCGRHCARERLATVAKPDERALVRHNADEPRRCLAHDSAALEKCGAQGSRRLP